MHCSFDRMLRYLFTLCEALQTVSRSSYDAHRLLMRAESVHASLSDGWLLLPQVRFLHSLGSVCVVTK